jgi:hypothetical protein
MNHQQKVVLEVVVVAVAVKQSHRYRQECSKVKERRFKKTFVTV